MLCVKCNSKMELNTIDGVEIDVCPQCGGIFLDDGEFQNLTGIDPGTGLVRLSRFVEVLSKFHDRAILDELTEVYTRKYYSDFIKNVFANKNRGVLTLIYVDIDYFKRVNDKHGHKSGDIVLKEVAKRLKSSLRVSRDEYIFRIGGEEFVIVLFNINREDSYNAAETLRKIIETDPIILPDGSKITINISVGVALSRQTDTPDTLYKRADNLLYKAKEAGRNRVTIE